MCDMTPQDFGLRFGPNMLSVQGAYLNVRLENVTAKEMHFDVDNGYLTHYNTLQHPATHCNTLSLTATFLHTLMIPFMDVQSCGVMSQASHMQQACHRCHTCNRHVTGVTRAIDMSQVSHMQQACHTFHTCDRHVTGVTDETGLFHNANHV